MAKTKTPTPTPAELRTASRKAKEWTVKRDEIIAARSEDGDSLRTIAADAELSHTAIRKILTR